MISLLNFFLVHSSTPHPKIEAVGSTTFYCQDQPLAIASAINNKVAGLYMTYLQDSPRSYVVKNTWQVQPYCIGLIYASNKENGVYGAFYLNKLLFYFFLPDHTLEQIESIYWFQIAEKLSYFLTAFRAIVDAKSQGHPLDNLAFDMPKQLIPGAIQFVPDKTISTQIYTWADTAQWLGKTTLWASQTTWKWAKRNTKKLIKKPQHDHTCTPPTHNPSSSPTVYIPFGFEGEKQTNYHQRSASPERSQNETKEDSKPWVISLFNGAQINKHTPDLLFLEDTSLEVADIKYIESYLAQREACTLQKLDLRKIRLITDRLDRDTIKKLSFYQLVSLFPSRSKHNFEFTPQINDYLQRIQDAIQQSEIPRNLKSALSMISWPHFPRILYLSQAPFTTEEERNSLNIAVGLAKKTTNQNGLLSIGTLLSAAISQPNEKELLNKFFQHIQDIQIIFQK